MDTSQYGEVRSQIVAPLQAARAASARSVNALMTASYWEIGHRIVEFEQGGEERAEYGEVLIKQLADPFVLEFLDLKDEYSETDLEDALIKHLTDFCWSSGTTSRFLDDKRDFGLMTLGSESICFSFTVVSAA